MVKSFGINLATFLCDGAVVADVLGPLTLSLGKHA